jgi:hypothetical protein
LLVDFSHSPPYSTFAPFDFVLLFSLPLLYSYFK